jgi:glycerol-3-phosphate dehydrogenase (NAD(P)+)
MKIAVIGAGSWGSALAQLLGAAGHQVNLWARDASFCAALNETHHNPRYLTDSELSANIVATNSFEQAFSQVEAAVLVTPSAYLRETARAAAPYVDTNLPVIVCSKGVELETGKLQSEILEDEIGGAHRIAVLSGPTHAEEVVRSVPSAAVCASKNEATAKFFSEIFATENFRTYTSTDICGVELCAAFKNVIAVAVGISYGIGCGDNTAAMLITRGLAEMCRMVVAAGGQALTCLGLAGAGDMVVTCTSRHSRNRRFGQDYAACGKTVADFNADTHMVVEGALACKTLDVLAQRLGVDLPITNAVRSIVWDGASPIEIAHELARRPLRPEF